MGFAAITLCVASQQVFTVVYFIIGSARKLLDTPCTFEFRRSRVKMLDRLQAALTSGLWRIRGFYSYPETDYENLFCKLLPTRSTHAPVSVDAL